jgi:hypothetical protein
MKSIDWNEELFEKIMDERFEKFSDTEEVLFEGASGCGGGCGSVGYDYDPWGGIW